MNITPKTLLDRYIENVLKITNNQINSHEILTIIQPESQKICNVNDIKRVFHNYTKQLLVAKLKPEDLGPEIVNGLNEVLSKIFIIESFPEISKIEYKENYYVESCIMEILVDIIGKSESIIILLTNPDSLTKHLQNIAYKKTNLLSYLQQKLEKAKAYNSSADISKSNAVLDCCEALSDCRKYLSLASLNKGIAYEKK